MSISLDESYAYCERVSRREAKNFYYTFLFLPPEKRRALYAAYTYARRLDDAVDAVEDHGIDPVKALADLAQLESFMSDEPPDDPLVPALRDAMQKYGVPAVHFEELAAGMRMDLDKRRYETFDELYQYCYRAASTVGLVCIEIFQYEGDPHQAAEDLGIAMQLTNIIRDVAEDLDRDRIYLPQEDLRRFECSEEELRAGKMTSAVRELIRFQVSRARDYFDRAEALMPIVIPESRYCPVLLKRFYSEILDTIEKRDFDVFSKRARISTPRKLRLALRTWRELRRDRRKSN